MSRKMIKMIKAPAHIITTARHRSEGLHKALLTFWQKCLLSFARTDLTIFSQQLHQPPLWGLSTIVKGENILSEVQQEAGLSLFSRDANKITLGASVEPLCSCVHEEYRLMGYVANMVAWSKKSLQVRFVKGTNTGAICRRYYRAQFRFLEKSRWCCLWNLFQNKFTRFFMSWLYYQAILHWQELRHVILCYDSNRDICSKQQTCLQASWTWQTPSWYFLFPALQKYLCYCLSSPKA